MEQAEAVDVDRVGPGSGGDQHVEHGLVAVLHDREAERDHASIVAAVGISGSDSGSGSGALRDPSLPLIRFHHDGMG